jgi:type I restriction-modification system specificity determinant
MDGRWGRLEIFAKRLNLAVSQVGVTISLGIRRIILGLNQEKAIMSMITCIEEYISQAGLDNSSTKIIPQHSVIMAMYGATAALVAYFACNTTTSQADVAYLFSPSLKKSKSH